MLDRNDGGVAEKRHLRLKRMQVIDLERARLAEPVAGGMGRIKMRTGNPPLRNRLGCRMLRPLLSSFGSTWVCGPSGLLPVGGGIG